MKTQLLKTGVALVVSSVMFSTASAQEEKEQRPRPRTGFLRMIPVIAALDADEDGELSAEEIANATKALTALDKDEDGRVSAAEMQPDFSRNRQRNASGENGENRPRRNRAAFTPPSADTLVERAMEYDADEDGVLSQEELKAMYEAQRSRFRRSRNNNSEESDGEDNQPRRRRRPESE